MPTWIPVGSAGNIVDLAIDHQPLITFLIVSLDLLPAVRVEAFSGHVTLPICLLFYRVFTSSHFLYAYTLDTADSSLKAPILCMLVFKFHCHCIPEISGLTDHKMTLFLPYFTVV